MSSLNVAFTSMCGVFYALCLFIQDTCSLDTAFTSRCGVFYAGCCTVLSHPCDGVFYTCLVVRT